MPLAPLPATAARTATIVIPTRDRPHYLSVALASLMASAAACGAEVLVIDDSGARRSASAVAARFGARYVAHPLPAGLNAARNTGLAHSGSELLVFVDDDIEAEEGWLEAMLDATAAHPEVDVFTGPIRARLEGHPPRSCGREGPPVTHVDLGDADVRTRFAWGANMAIRRAAFTRAGEFDPTIADGGDEQEWQERLEVSGGGGAFYVAKAAVSHRRSPADSRLSALMRAGFRRGRGSRRFDAMTGKRGGLAGELWTLVGCLAHTLLRRCPNGLTMVAHSAGRACEALAELRARDGADMGAAENDDDDADFLSGESGTVGGAHGLMRRASDAAIDSAELCSGWRSRLDTAAAAHPSRVVLAIGVVRRERAAMAAKIAAELAASHHDVSIATTASQGRGKFESLNALLVEQRWQQIDWLLVIDDDITLPRGFLDRFLFLAERFELDLAQPAHAWASHAAWQVTRRQAWSAIHETRFVEIGPVTAFAKRTLSRLLPFPELAMGWGLDLHWAAVAEQEGWRCGVIDATAIRHMTAPVADAYSRASAIAEARGFLAQRPYLSAGEANEVLAVRRRW